MSLATLSDVLQPALRDGYAVAGLVCLGWEDARAFVAAGEAENCPVILQAGPGWRAHIPIEIIGKMFVHLAEEASVPVVAHLDHGYSLDECKAALDAGFTSLMYDGSRKALAQNIDETAQIVELAHANGASCEGEIGFVGYAHGEGSNRTDPGEALEFAEATKVDAMAISVGNVHLQHSGGAGLDRARIGAIEARTDIPLVIHGGSGVEAKQRRTLALQTHICKFNIGTQLRMVFGSALRDFVRADRNAFDRIEILAATHAPLKSATRRILRNLMK